MSSSTSWTSASNSLMRRINEPVVEAETTQEIYLHNFKIPLSIYPTLLSYGLTEYRGVLLDLKPLKKDGLSRNKQTEETMSNKIAFDALWDESPIDVTPEVNFIWSIANKLRGSYMPDKYGDVIIPMTILRRLECALEPTKKAVTDMFAKNPNYPPKAMYRISGYQFYNTSPYTLKELCNEPDNIKSNFKVYIQGFSAEVQEIFNAKAALKALKPTNYNTGIMQLNNWWPEIPEKGDVSDYIAAKGEEAVAKLKETLDVVTRNRKPAPAVKAVPVAQCSTATVTVAATSAPLMLKTCGDYRNVIKKLDPYSNPKYSTTDNGSGRLFSDIVKGQARYVASRKSWFIYDGTRWAPDEGNMATMEMCKTIGDALTHYAFEIKDEKERREYLRYTMRWMTRNYRKTILDDAASVYNIGMGEFDADVNLLNCKNGTLDLKTMQFRSHNPDDKITKIADVVYNPNAKCPRFDQFLTEVMSGDADKSAFLQKALGYALSGDSRFECLFFLYGATTRNGKSTLMESVLRVFGDYGLTVAPETIAAKQRNSSGPSEDLARLAGRRLANISEPSRGMRLNAAQVKSMTGNDSINARFLHCNSFDFRPQFKLYINTNYAGC